MSKFNMVDAFGHTGEAALQLSKKVFSKGSTMSTVKDRMRNMETKKARHVVEERGGNPDCEEEVREQVVKYRIALGVLVVLIVVTISVMLFVSYKYKKIVKKAASVDLENPNVSSHPHSSSLQVSSGGT